VRHDYSLLAASVLHQLRRAPRLLVSRLHGSTSTLSCAVVPLDFLSVGRTGSRRAPGHCVSRRDYLSSGLHWLYCAYVVHLGASSRRSTSRQSVALALAVCPVIPLCVVTTRLAAATDILRLRHASGCLGTSRDSSSTTSTMPRVLVPRHVTRLVVNYFDYAARPGASARRAARHAARRRLLRLCRAFGCLGTSRGSSRGSSSTTSTMTRVWVPRHVARLVTRLVVDYFNYATRPGALARCTAHRRLLRLHRASGCFGTSRGLSRGSSSTTSTMPRVRVPRHVARLVVDNFDYDTRSGALARHAARRRLLQLCHASGCLGTLHSSSSTTSPTPRVRLLRHVARLVAWLIIDYFAHVARPGASARHSADYSWGISFKSP
jgi:hypothetical protein